MDFLKKSAWSFSAVIARGVGALAINKIFAIYFGTTGITLLAHFQNLISIFTQIPSDGINRGIINQWANPQLPEKEKQETLSSGILLTAISFTLIMVVVFIFREIFVAPFINFISGGIFLIILIFSVLAILANALVQSLIIAKKKIKLYAIITILSVGVLLGLLAWSVDYQLLEVAFVAYALGNSIGLLFSLVFLKWGMQIKIQLEEPGLKSLKNILQFILMAVSVLAFGKLIDFFIRTLSIEWFGMIETGYWQSLVKLSDAYVMIFVGTLGAVFFPEVSSKVNDRKALFSYLNQTLWIIIPVLSVIMLIVFMLGEPLLKILFSEEFVPAYQYMHWQLAGDLIMLIAYLFAYILMAKQKTLWYILLQFISASVYVSTILLLKNAWDVEAILIAHLSRNIVFFAILLFMIRKV